MTTAEQLAERFHEAYERLASEHGYVTRPESAVPWADVPEQNKRLMIAVCDELTSLFTCGQISGRRATHPLPRVIGEDRWSDEYRPTVAGDVPCRVAAEAMLHGLDWVSIFEEADYDPLVFWGTVTWLTEAFKPARVENTLIAWFASRLWRVNMCMTDGHENADDIRWFNDCWGADDDDGDSCVWESWWAIDADPCEFWSFAQQVARRRR